MQRDLNYCYMCKIRYHIILLLLLLSIPVVKGESLECETVADYGVRYGEMLNEESRLKQANEFFDFLYRIEYLDEPIVFADGSDIDSVDVNVYYYIAEWWYSEGDYSKSVDYCLRAAARCSSKVNDNSKGDVYSLLGAAYFRLGEFDKAAEALSVCYAIDSKSGDYDQLSSTLNNIAGVFVAAGKPEEAEKYILEAIAANSLTDNVVRRAVLYGTASEMYRSMGDGELSLSYTQKALAIERERKDSAKIGVRLSQVANAELGLSQINKAKRSLQEAIPLLRASGNLHSLGICMNQMGDILASEGKDSASAEYYREAAGIFMTQSDKYNELHAREGLARVLKNTAPNEALLHLERAKMLNDSIYSHQTSETISKYNAIYYNDLLKQTNARTERQKRIIEAVAIGLVVIMIIVCVVALIVYMRHKRQKADYEKELHSLQHRYDQVNRLYRNAMIESLPDHELMTDEDKLFINELTKTIDEQMVFGRLDIESVSHRMRISPQTLRRRLQKTLSLTPQAYFTQVRMNKAKYILQNDRDVTITEVAEKCGYSLITNFTRAFTRYYGVKPTEMRR